jgi:hypothetical protein
MAEEQKDLKAADPGPLARLVMADMPDGAVIVKSRCKLCTSSLRKDVEKMYDDGKPVTDIKKFLDEKCEAIPVASISMHLRDHYRDAVKMVKLVEYMDSLAAIRERRQSRRDLVETTININIVELSRLLPMQTNGDVSREKDRTDMILKTINSLREGEKMLMEMEGAEEEVKSMQQKFVGVWKAKIEGAKSEEERQIYISTLQEFKRLLQGDGR